MDMAGRNYGRIWRGIEGHEWGWRDMRDSEGIWMIYEGLEMDEMGLVIGECG